MISENVGKVKFVVHPQMERVAPTDRILSAPTFHHNGYAVAAQPPIKYEAPPPPPQRVQHFDWVEGEGFNVVEVEVDTVDRSGQVIYNRNMPDLGM